MPCQHPLEAVEELRRNIVLRNVVASFQADIEHAESRRQERLNRAQAERERLKEKLRLAKEAGKPMVCMVCTEMPANTATLQCKECNVLYCDDCRKYHPTRGKLALHNLVDLESPDADPLSAMLPVHWCEAHPNSRVEFFCQTCQTPCCANCLLLGNHANHERADILPTADERERVLSAHASTFLKAEAELDAFAGRLEDQAHRIAEDAERLRGDIDVVFETMRRDLERKREELLTTLDEREKLKLKLVEQQRQATLDRKSYIVSTRERIEAALQEMDPIAFLQDVPSLLRKAVACERTYGAPTHVVRSPTVGLSLHRPGVFAAVRMLDFEELANQARHLEPGMWIDCRDSVRRWQRAMVLEVDLSRHKVLVKYDGWDDRWNDWVPLNSRRIQPFGLVTSACQPGDLRGKGPPDGAPLFRGNEPLSGYSDE